MTDLPNPFVEKLAAHFGTRVQVLRQRDEVTLEVAPADYLAVMTELRDHAGRLYDANVVQACLAALDAGEVAL